VPFGKRERHDDDITAPDFADLTAHCFHNPDRLVSHHTAGVGWFHSLIRPEIAPANAGTRDRHDRVGWFNDPGVRHVLNPNVAGAIHDSCPHGDLPPVFQAFISITNRYLAFFATTFDQASSIPFSEIFVICGLIFWIAQKSSIS